MFEKITIQFKGQDFTVPANKVFGLIASIEQHITIQELHDKPKNTAIANAYAAAINYAGGDAKPHEVYEMLFDLQGALNIRTAVTNLVMMMVPPAAIREAMPEPELPSTKKKPARSA
jgi:hypothetical protein